MLVAVTASVEQFALWHWLLPWHEPPLATFVTHAPPLQYDEELQLIVCGAQAPCPLHAIELTCVVSVEHVGVAQLVLEPG